MDWERFYYTRTKLEKALIFAVTSLCIVVIVLFICFLSAGDDYVCKDPQCVRAANHILDTVDQEADPCEEFYKFACGSFLKNAFVMDQPTTLSALSALTKNQLRNIIMEKRNESSLPKTLRMQRKFYRACINTTTIEKDKDEKILQLLDEVTGGWPVLKTFNWNEGDFEWSRAIVNARNLGLYYEFFFNVDVFHNRSSDRSKLWIQPPSASEVSAFKWINRKVPSFQRKDQILDIMTDIANLMGAESVSVNKELRLTMTFAEKLQNIIEVYYTKTLSSYEEKEVKTIGSLSHKLMKIDWFNFLRNITGLPLRESDEVVFDMDDYLNELYYLLQHRTTKKTLANYMAWAIISNNIHYLSEKVRNKYDELSRYYNDSEVDTPSRTTKCLKLSTGLFQSIAESEYIRRYTPDEKLVHIREMITYIKKEMEESLKVTPWMDDKSRANALEQLKNITEAIGWTDVVFDVEKVDKLNGYDKLTFTSDNVIDMARAATQAKVDNYYRQIRMNSTELYRLSAPSLDIDAYFARQFNILILPAPVLQGQIFDSRRPHYLNYGALGSLIGHELTHGFSTFDDWMDSKEMWTNRSVNNFVKESRCLVEEYEHFQKNIETPITKNRSMLFWENETLLGENLADFTGVNLAYTAYQNWVKEHGIEKSLPGIKFTPNQIFWIMASTYMCYEPRLSEKDDILTSDYSHGHPVFRVVGRLRNSPYFAKDFNCPEGSKMNKKQKCRIYW
ncbi:hypothetical protein JTB14_027331 [Gonioctena quinquepunctata]|nr:hypothetical protein JTB14_027331 [Gonioctena quinquepunctata]